MDENEKNQNKEKFEDTAPRKLFLVFTAGFILVFIGVLMVIVGSVLENGGSASVGGVVFVGPFPIVFGVGADAGWLVLLGIVIAITSLVLFLFMRRKLGWVVG